MTLQEMLDDYEERAPWEVNYDHHDGRYWFSRHVLEEPPQDAALVLGDALHNTRSALDLLVVALADYSQGRRLSDEETERLGFPIPKKPTSLETFLGRLAKPGEALSSVGPALIERIWNVQATSQWLPNLRDLSNRDKHRRLNVIIVTDKSPTVAIWNGPEADLNFEFDHEEYVASVSDACAPERVSLSFACRLDIPALRHVSIGGFMGLLLNETREAVRDITRDIAADVDPSSI
ncbi:hypothetical protein [Mumia quercus]|uniref:hypothetical protein n=1 Tax=Mumia quercus TaxID=2976125 RepID=UPI0021D0A40D|nr:hypothetical protein [Mumia quercus]